MYTRIIEYFDHFLKICQSRIASNPKKFAEKCTPIIVQINRLKRDYSGYLNDKFGYDGEQLPIETPTIKRVVDEIQVYLHQAERSKHKFTPTSSTGPIKTIPLSESVTLTKEQVQNHIERLESMLKENLNDKKQEVCERIKLLLNPGGESEGLFTKLYLSPSLHRIFGNYVAIEGMHSNGKTQYKEAFFGAKPAPDFIIDRFRIVGEVKYEPLATRKLSTAIGQVIMYMAASKVEFQRYDYGCVIFFDTSKSLKPLTKEELNFITSLRDKSNVFIILI